MVALRITLLVAVVLTTACAPAVTEPRPPVHWPTMAWAEDAPEAQGVSSAGLAALLEAARARQLPLHALLVVRHGAIVLEAYAHGFGPDTLHDIASVTKSVVSTLVGIAIAQGAMPGLDATLADLYSGEAVPEPLDGRPVTLRHLLAMTSGLACESAPTERTLMDMVASPDWLAFALSRPAVAAPGERWVYDSVGSHMLSAALTLATGAGADEFAREQLFTPLGIRRFAWPRDPQGIAHGMGDLRLRPRDMARLGLLFLQGGRWRDGQLVPRDWVVAATSDEAGPSGPEGGYGYQWWLAPGGFFASGRGGQFIYIAPAADLVVVTTAGAARGSGDAFGALLQKHLVPAVGPPTPLPPNPEGQARLRAAVAALASAPTPEPVLRRAMAQPLARYALDDNLLGWTAVRLVTDDDTALLTVEVDGQPTALPVGLDGVPRLTRGARFTRSYRHAATDIALRGRWADRLTFVVDFDTRALIDRGTLSLRFSEDLSSVTVTVLEETFLGIPIEITGRRD